MKQNKLFDGTSRRLCIDQYGDRIWASTLRELREKSGTRSAPYKQYLDKKSGEVVWTGYVIGRRWFTIYAPCEVTQ